MNSNAINQRSTTCCIPFKTVQYSVTFRINLVCLLQFQNFQDAISHLVTVSELESSFSTILNYSNAVLHYKRHPAAYMYEFHQLCTEFVCRNFLQLQLRSGFNLLIILNGNNGVLKFIKNGMHAWIMYQRNSHIHTVYIIKLE